MPLPAPGSGTKRFGDRLSDWLQGIWPFSALYLWFQLQDTRKAELGNWLAKRGLALMYGPHVSWLPETLLAFLYFFIGLDLIDIKNPKDPGVSAFSNPEQFIADSIRTVTGSAVAGDISRILGTLISEPILGVLERYADEENPDPKAMARAFHGASAVLSVQGGLVSTAVEAATGGAIKNAGKPLEALYWNLGLGFLGWQTLAPLLSSGLQPKLERFYNKLYRPQRFTAAQMSDLFALGKRSANELRDVLNDLGWRDQDIEQWIELSYRTLGEGDVFDLYKSGTIKQDELVRRLRALGYKPDEIPLVIKARDDNAKAAKETLVSTAKQAFLKDLISVDDFQRIMRENRSTEEEITLQIALINLQKQGEANDFTRGDIHTLLTQRVIARPEAENYLVKDAGMTAPQANLLVSAWENADAPKAVRINQGTIREAFTDGVLTRDECKNRLTSVGYESADAELIVKTWETETLPARVVPGPRGAGPLTLGQLSQLAAASLISKPDMLIRPELEKYDTADRTKLVDLMFLQAPTDPTRLGDDTLYNAYYLGLIDRTELISRYEQAGLSAADAALKADVVDAKIAGALASSASGTLKLPSIGSIQLAFQRGLIDEAGARERLFALGLNEDAVRIYMFNAQYQVPAKPELLPRATVLDLYSKGKIGRSDCQYRLVQLGYTVADAQLLIEAEHLLPEDLEMGQAYIAGLVSQEATTTWFETAGFTTEEISAFFTQYPAG